MNLQRVSRYCLIIALAGASAGHASSPDAWAKLDKASAKACRVASGLRDATVGPSMHFSDDLALDARMVTGVYPQAHMKGASGKMLCLYSRHTKRAEVQEIAP